MSCETPTSSSVTAQRYVIRHCVRAGMTPTDTLKFVNTDHSKPTCSRALVFRWHKRFKDGVDDIHDQKRSGRPLTNSNQSITAVKDVLQEDRRRTVREISDKLQLKRSTVHRIMANDLNVSKVSARWVPKILSMEEKTVRVSVSEMYLNRYSRESDRFLNQIVTTDETYISLYEPETKFESMVWKHPSSPPPTKAKRCRSTTRFMFIFFMDSQRMLLSHAVPKGLTVNADYYQKIIRRDLAHAIRKKRPGMALENLLFHQDNAPPHRSHETLLTIDFLGYERIIHAPYSPDLAPFDFAVFPRLKSDLRGRRYEDLDDLKMAVRSAVRKYSRDWYGQIFRQWIERHRKCVNAKGEYFEKL